ncbi:MAG: DinB family protein [Acidimicrobiales bacterium]
MERIDPPLHGPERESLIAWLQYHRATLELKCSGLSPDHLCAQAIPPSPLSLIGLVRHMAEVERAWFGRLLAESNMEATPPIYFSKSNPDGDFDDIEPAVVDQDMAIWLEECRRSDEIVAPLGLDNSRTHPGRGEISVRWVLTHMIEEYARHNGHADLLREVIDGSTGD